MSKTDYELGLTVHDYLKVRGVETPMNPVNITSKDEQRLVIETNFRNIMQALGLNLDDDSLTDTPRRVAKMYVDEIFYGLDYANFPKCTTVDNKMKYDEMVLERDISVMSNCEHHFVIISGKACVAYIPNKKVLGLSKINRIVEFFSKRPQIQERLTEQIYHAMSLILETDNVAVMIEAEHYCVKSRGVKDEGSSTVTSKLGGSFRIPAVRQEFLSLARRT